jgi:hypothetical protein
MSCKILPCTCKHDYQDAKHGAGKRVKNKMKTPKGTPEQHRCTVCGSTGSDVKSK